MTACNPADRKPATSKCTVLLDCLHGIRGAGWIITARGWKQRRHEELITANSCYERILHQRPAGLSLNCELIWSISPASCWKVTAYAVDRVRMTMSTAPMPGMIRVRASSRRRLRSRLRSTIVWPCFETITATLACENGEPLARTSRCSVRNRFPVRFTCSRSDSRVSR